MCKRKPVEVQFQKGAKNDSRLKGGKRMRDSDMAIRRACPPRNHRGLCLFSLPEFHNRDLGGGPSYNDIVRAQEHEIATFNHETEVVFSYLTDSWTIKPYRRIGRMVGRDAYENSIQQLRQKGTFSSGTLFNTESQRQIADSLSRSLESRKASATGRKESIFKLSKSPLDSEIEALQVELDKKGM